MTHASNLPVPGVGIAVWKRVANAPEIIRRLAAEAPHVVVWNNSGQDLGLDPVPPNVVILTATTNIGERGKYLAALRVNSDPVITWDDDAMPLPGWGAAFAQAAQFAAQGALVGWFARRFRQRHNVIRTSHLLSDPSHVLHADYVGSCCAVMPKAHLLGDDLWRDWWPCRDKESDVRIGVYARVAHDADLLCDYRLRAYVQDVGRYDACSLTEMFRSPNYDPLYPKDWELAVDREKRVGPPRVRPRIDPATVPIQGLLARPDVGVLIAECEGRRVVEFGAGATSLILARCAASLDVFEPDAKWTSVTEARLKKIGDKTCNPRVHHCPQYPDTVPPCDVLIIDGTINPSHNRAGWADRFAHQAARTVMVHDSRLKDAIDPLHEITNCCGRVVWLDRIEFHPADSHWILVRRRPEPVPLVAPIAEPDDNRTIDAEPDYQK